MVTRGWQKLTSKSPTQTIRDLSWQKDQFIASDVRPENAILAESDQQIYPIDFIVGGKELQ
ncbi:hypothetical protein N9124_01555 [bacterium]|nr:hypothetical protein [bacterium]MDA7862437.1 hypothetical protein [Akkermansiaceae bacterium]MDB4272989.1 hypothetical protein [Akkermansiaceae bacterium]MDB4283349.1 hypothetical protein [Akkermansiaceae bacterium]MDB4387652.1 hypothetical protein [Akkermansiaceae bacterium]